MIKIHIQISRSAIMAAVTGIAACLCVGPALASDDETKAGATARCEANLRELAEVVATQQIALSQCTLTDDRDLASENAQLARELDACNRIDRQTNVLLQQELDHCRNAPRADPESLRVLETQLADAQNELMALEDRLAETEAALQEARAEADKLSARMTDAGLSANPDYTYVNGVFDSFVPRDGVADLVRTVPLLTQDKCREALDWMARQAGDNRPLRPLVWVERPNGQPALCSLDGQGEVILRRPTASDEAHVLVFK
jgi:hypothetical protein